MKYSIKGLFLLLIFFLITVSINSAQYYICLGSFVEERNYNEFAIKLQDSGIDTVLEEIRVSGKIFTRVLTEAQNGLFREINTRKSLMGLQAGSFMVKKLRAKNTPVEMLDMICIFFYYVRKGAATTTLLLNRIRNF